MEPCYALRDGAHRNVQTLLTWGALFRSQQHPKPEREKNRTLSPKSSMMVHLGQIMIY